MGSPKSRRMIHDLAQSLVPPDRPGAFANAMMEMGATMCTPKSPSCLLCPVRAGCKGYAQGMAERTCPSSPEKKAQRVEMRCVMLVFCQNRVLTVLQAGAPARRPFRLSGCGRGAVARADVRGARVSWAFPPPTTRGSAAPEHVFTHLIWEMEIHAFAADKPRRRAGRPLGERRRAGGPAHAYGSQGRAQICGGYAYARQRLSVGRY
ncbi:MAG: hypothetical protein ACLUHE_04500 [Christensenellales bacterium]